MTITVDDLLSELNLVNMIQIFILYRFAHVLLAVDIW